MSAPPNDDAALEAEVRLALVSGVGPRIRQALRERFGTAAASLAAPLSELREVEGVGPKVARSIAEARTEVDAAEEIAYCRANGIDLILDTSAAYPHSLKQITDPPGILFVRGTLLPEDALAVAIVGTRHCTHYGTRQAERLGYTLAQAGFTIVSGLARGIDAAAHRGAIQAGGRTIAVLAGSLVEVYPPEHQTLAAEIVERGAVLCEAPPRAPPTKGIFPQRNRIISGLSLGVLVVEAPQASGSLNTAKHAVEQNREVFAVPGPIDSRASQGCHRLLRDGAVLVETADDVLEALGPLEKLIPRPAGEPALSHPAELQLNEQEKHILAALGQEPTSLDLVATRCELPIHRVLATVSALEMRRLVKRVSGNLVMRAYARE